ncbi:MAG: hypothetical protein WCJ61_09015 [Paludibacter sp.]
MSKTAPGYLTLVLTRKWFDMIDECIKKEEYREIKPFWSKVFDNKNVIKGVMTIKIKGIFHRPENVIIEFCHGYGHDRDKFMCHCLGLEIGTGKPEWGAEKDKQYYVLKLGEPF